MAQSLSAGERILRWRELKGWSLEKLATESGVYKSSIWRMEKGKQEPKTDEMEKIAAALGLTVPEFYGAFRDLGGSSADPTPDAAA